MSIYDDMRGVASDLIGEFDQSKGTGEESDGLWYVAVVPGTGPADDPGPSTPTRTKLDATARGVSFKYVDNSLILATDLQLTTPAREGFAPNMKGRIEMDGASYKIVAIHNVPPSGVTVTHRIFFRK
jgi:hypothetical protein